MILVRGRKCWHLGLDVLESVLMIRHGTSQRAREATSSSRDEGR
jgi:hypothetical protein